MKSLVSKLFIPLIVFSVAFLPVSSVFAAQTMGLNKGFDEVTKIQSKSGVKNFTSVAEIIRGVLKAGLVIVPIIALVIIIVAGIMYMTALGDEKKTERAKMVILYTVIGLIIVMLAGFITNFVINLIQ